MRINISKLEAAKLRAAKLEAESFILDRRTVNPNRLGRILMLGSVDPVGTLAELSPEEAAAVVRLARYALVRLVVQGSIHERSW